MDLHKIHQCVFVVIFCIKKLSMQIIKSVGFDFNVLAYLIVDQHSRSTIIFFFYVQLPSNTELAAF